MPFERPADQAPQPLQMAAGAGLVLVGNLATMFGCIGLGILCAGKAQLLDYVAAFSFSVILLQGLLQWLVVLPLCALQWSARRELAIGALLGGLLFMIGHTGCHAMLLLGPWLIVAPAAPSPAQ